MFRHLPSFPAHLLDGPKILAPLHDPICGEHCPGSPFHPLGPTASASDGFLGQLKRFRLRHHTLDSLARAHPGIRSLASAHTSWLWEWVQCVGCFLGSPLQRSACPFMPQIVNALPHAGPHRPFGAGSGEGQREALLAEPARREAGKAGQRLGGGARGSVDLSIRQHGF